MHKSTHVLYSSLKDKFIAHMYIRLMLQVMEKYVELQYKREAKEEESSEESDGENSEAESHNNDVNVPEMDQSK